MPLSWQLQRDDYSPGRAGFGVEGGRVSEVYQSSEYASPAAVEAAIVEILGDVTRGTTATNSAGRLVRKLPRGHPFFPWCSATRVELQGFGNTDSTGAMGAKLLPTILFLEAPVLVPPSGLHFQYVRTMMTVTFEPRPYALLTDQAVNPTLLSWRNSANTLITTDVDSLEYVRYVDVESDPNPEVIYAQHGQMRYVTTGAAPGALPHTFMGHPQMTLPDSSFKVTWYQVPYSLFLSPTHPMHSLVGRINQTTFFDRLPGSLLYLGAKARRYTPIVPIPERVVSGSSIFTNEKLCDITFHFNYTARTSATAPTPPLVNENWIPSGWNLQPWYVDRRFHYVTANFSASAAQIPIYLSAPMQLLFLVPDAGGSYTTVI